MQTSNKLTPPTYPKFELLRGGLANFGPTIAECFAQADREADELFSLTRRPWDSNEAESEIIFSVNLSHAEKVTALKELRESMKGLAPILEFPE